MKTVGSILAALAGAVGGFIAALYLAFVLGFHEKLHVFGIALIGATLCSVASVAAMSKASDGTPGMRGALMVVLAIAAFGFVFWLLHIIQIL